MAFAAELALKFAYEQEHPSGPAPPIHDLQKLFGKLGQEKRQKIEVNYESLLKGYKQQRSEECDQFEDWWETASQLFEKCKDTFVDWRYIEEKGQHPDPFIMRAALLVVSHVWNRRDRGGEVCSWRPGC